MVGLFGASAPVSLIYKWAKRDLKKVQKEGGDRLLLSLGRGFDARWCVCYSYQFVLDGLDELSFDQYLVPNTCLRHVRLWYTCVFISSYLISFLIVHFHILPIFTYR